MSMNSQYLKRVMTVALVLVLACATHAMAVEPVVVLHSSPSATGWTDGVVRGLASELGDSVQISQVFLGSPTDDDEHFDAQFEQLSSQWGATSPFAVVVDGVLAFAFIRKYREDIFTASPVLYCAMPRPGPLLLSQCGDCSGVPIEYGVAETVDLIFTLRPDTTTVVGVMDGTTRSRVLRQSAEAAMEAYLDRAQILFPGFEPGDDGGLDSNTVLSVASSTPRSGAILLLGFSVDNQGNPVDTASIVRRMAEKSAAPVYVVTDQWLGSAPAVLGGVVVSGEAQGRELATMVQRLRDGEPASEMLGEAVEPQPVIDLTVLARFGLSKAALPSDARTLNAPETPEQAEEIAPTGVAALIGGGLILLVLFVLFRRRKRFR